MRFFKLKFMTAFLFVAIILQHSNFYAFCLSEKASKSIYKSIFDEKQLELIIKKICEKKYLILSVISEFVFLGVVFVGVKKILFASPDYIKRPDNSGLELVIKKEPIVKQVKVTKIRHIKNIFSNGQMEAYNFDFESEEDVKMFVLMFYDFNKEDQERYLEIIPENVKSELEVVKYKEKVSNIILKIEKREPIDISEWEEAQKAEKFYKITVPALGKKRIKTTNGFDINVSYEYNNFLKKFIGKNKLEIYNLLLKIYENKNDEYDNKITKKDFVIANKDRVLGDKDFDIVKNLYSKFIEFKVWKI